MKKYIFLLIAALLILFCFSSMSYQQQTLVPSLQQILKDKPLYGLLSKIEVTYWGQLISVETRGYYYFLEFLIRKGLHFTGFGAIAILLYFLYRKLIFRWAVLYAIATTFIIASLDEYRQTFVEGRTGIFDDVLIDTAGAFTFLFLLKVFQFLFSKAKRSYLRI